MTVAVAHACRAYALTSTTAACLSCKKVRGEGGGRGDQGSSGVGAMRAAAAAAAAAAVPGTSFLCGGRRTMSSLEIDSGLMALIPSRQGVGVPSPSHRCHMSLLARKSELLLPPFQDTFLPYLAEAAQSADLLPSKDFGDKPPLLDVIQAKMARDASAAVRMGATSPAEVSRGGNYGQHKPKRPPPDLPSLLLNSRIIYLGMPLVPAVTELIVAELLYLQWLDPRQPIYLYINSTGTSRADGETVGMETEGFCIYDTMMHVKNEVMTVGVGAAIGQACLLLAAGDKGKRFMLPHATAMIQQPRLPSAGQMTAADIAIRAKEVVKNRDTLVELLARNTGNPVEVVAKKMERPFYMNATKAIKFGVIDKILWQGQEAIAETLSTESWDEGAGIRVVEKPAYAEGGSI